MAWADAKQIAEGWVSQRLPQEMHGKSLELVNFETDADAAFFYPGRTAEFQRMINSAIARQARKRKARTMYVKITPQEYHDLREKNGVEDTPEEREAFIEACHRIIG